MNGYQQICLFMSQKKKKKREMNLLILELIECSSEHLHATPTLGPNYEFALLFWKFFSHFAPLSLLFPQGQWFKHFRNSRSDWAK